MKKLQVFILLEMILLGLAMVSILATDFSRFVLMLLLLILLFYYYLGKQRNNFLLVSSSLLFFFIVMLNPFVIAAVVLAFLYLFFEAWVKMDKKNPETHLRFKEDLEIHQGKNRWFGDFSHFNQENCQFDDIHMVRLSGRDVVHLEDVILNQHDNIILLHKGFGDTQIIVPVDVEVCLKVNVLYGDLRFFENDLYPMRNESLSLTSPHFKKSHKSVKIIITSLLGNVEVIRK